MEKSFTENLNAKGHLTISKLKDGQEEIIFDDKNVIVSGFGWALAYLFSKQGSDSITDFQVDRFQLGVSGNVGAQVSSTVQLSGPLTSLTQYNSGDSNLFAFSGYQIKNGAVITSPSIYGKIPFTKVSKIDDRAVRYTILVDEYACNNLNLSEIGLFMKNPLKNNPEAPILIAYKYFSTIAKTDDFALVFRWSITFG